MKYLAWKLYFHRPLQNAQIFTVKKLSSWYLLYVKKKKVCSNNILQIRIYSCATASCSTQETLVAKIKKTHLL